MEVVAGIHARPHPLGMGRIAHQRIEIHDPIEMAGRADPGVDRLPVGLIDPGRMIELEAASLRTMLGVRTM